MVNYRVDTNTWRVQACHQQSRVSPLRSMDRRLCLIIGPRSWTIDHGPLIMDPQSSAVGHHICELPASVPLSKLHVSITCQNYTGLFGHRHHPDSVQARLSFCYLATILIVKSLAGATRQRKGLAGSFFAPAPRVHITAHPAVLPTSNTTPCR